MTTFVGPVEANAGHDGSGTSASFQNPFGVAVDSAGNVYVSDTANHTIRKVTPSGVVSTLAGEPGVSGSADGTGSAARFNSPRGLAVDAGGNVYVADRLNSLIRRVSPAGVVTTLAGQAGVAGSTDGTGSAALFAEPSGITVDNSGNLYIADTNNYTVRKITPAGVVSTLAGLAGSFGSADGNGSAARFRSLAAVAVDGTGNVYVADSSNHTIRAITPAGDVTTIAGLALSAGHVDDNGSAARFDSPSGIAVGPAGVLYVSEAVNQTIRHISLTGDVTTLAGMAGSAGSANGTGSAARFNQPQGAAVDSGGNVYVADRFNSLLRKISPTGDTTTLAGKVAGPGSADGTSSDARFNFPTKLAVDSSGNIFVADSANHTIRMITPAGVVTTFAGMAGVSGTTDDTGSAARFNDPAGVTVDSNDNVYVADAGNHTIRRITPAGVVTTFAGMAGNSGYTDGTGSAARFVQPNGLAIDSSDNIYVADRFGRTIRRITPAGAVTTLAGTGGVTGSADGTGAAAEFNQPRGLAVDSSGNVYVADTPSHTIRMVTQAGVVTTIAGLAGSAGSADGTGSAARFSSPADITLDSSGNLLVASSSGHTIRRVTPAGVVTTVAGNPGVSGSADGTGSNARLNFTSGIAAGPGGQFFCVDTNQHTIRRLVVAIADIATVDQANGLTGQVRQLGTAPQTATAWQWTIIRRPPGSVATFSSDTIGNPTFTPDTAGEYVIRLFAAGPGGESFSTVELNVAQAPGGGKKKKSGCSTSESASPWWFAIASLALLLAVRRRRIRTTAA